MKYQNTKSKKSRSDAQRKKILLVAIAIIVALACIATILGSLQENMTSQNSEQKTDEQYQLADITAEDGGQNGAFSESTALVGDTGVTIYNFEMFNALDINISELSAPLSAYAETSLVTLDGFNIRYIGCTGGTSGSEFVAWFETNNNIHPYLRMSVLAATLNADRSITITDASEEAYSQAIKNLANASSRSTVDTQAQQVLSEVQFFDMSNAPVEPEDIAVSFKTWKDTYSSSAASVSYVQSSGSTGGINMWFNCDDPNYPYLICQMVDDEFSWTAVDSIGSTKVVAPTNAQPDQSKE